MHDGEMNDRVPHRPRTTTADVHVFADGFSFPEAPTWFEGHLWVSDVIGGGVTELRADGRALGRRLQDRRGIGGMVVTQGGRLIASGRDLVDVISGTTVLARPDGSSGLNDLGVTGEGDLLVGVLNYRPLAGEPAVPGSVGRVTPDAVDWTWTTEVIWPNGIGVLSDGTIVVADFAEGVLRALGAERNGSTNGRVSTTIGTSRSGHFDGLCIDDSDHIWVATGPGRTLARLDRTGRLVDQVELPAAFVSSVCFSGDDPHRLFVTVSGCALTADGGGAVLAIDVDTPGAPPRTARM